MRIVRWILLLLYVGLLGSLYGIGLFGDSDPVPALVLLAITVSSLAMFILGAGHKDLCRPIHRPRLWLPVTAAAFMMAVLVGGLTLALGELFRVDDRDGRVPGHLRPDAGRRLGVLGRRAVRVYAAAASGIRRFSSWPSWCSPAASPKCWPRFLRT